MKSLRKIVTSQCISKFRNDLWSSGTTFGIRGRCFLFLDDLWSSGTTFGIPGRHLEFRDDHWKFRDDLWSSGTDLEFRDDLWTSGANFGIPGRPLEFREDLLIPGRVELTHSPQGTRTCDLLNTSEALFVQYLHGSYRMLSN
jgi:hypothetical protein